jgi:hypothetical protein
LSYADFKNRFTVIDEADEMLDHDWSEELQKIMAGGGTFSLLSHFAKGYELRI